VLKPEAIQGDFKRHPIIVPSSSPSRMVGCCCEDDYGEVVWFELRAENGVQKCDCGRYFKLVAHDPLDKRVKPKFGQGFGSGLSTYYY